MTETKRKNIQEKNVRGWFPTDPTTRAGNQKLEPSTRRAAPTVNDRLVGGLGAAGFGLILSAIVFYFVPAYPKQADVTPAVCRHPHSCSCIPSKKTR